MDKKIAYRYCIVPLCTNTTFQTPEKYFFHVPNDKKVRDQWCKIMRRHELLSTKTSRHCCEDHFNIQSDTENYMRWRLCGGTLKLKQGAVPTKFECQKNNIISTVTRPEYDNNQKIDFYKTLLTEELRVSVAQQETVFLSCDNAPDDMTSVAQQELVVNSCDYAPDDMNNPLPIDNTIHIEKKKTHNKKNQEEQQRKYVQTKTIQQNKNIELISQNLATSFDSDRMDCSVTSELSSSNSDSIETCEVFTDTVENTVLKIENHSKLYLGIPKQSYFVISLLSENTKAPIINILITLKKIKLNDSYLRLEIDFNTKNVSWIIRKTVVLLASCLKRLIYLPEKEAVREKLPLPFRRRYSSTVSIVDCFEIRIEKPSNALHQALTWSQNKSCNTIKYLVSITPDGLINFVSDGYGGMTTDTDIFEDCKIFELMPRGSAIMTDRAFKNIAADVEICGSQIVRPPSVSTGTPSTKDEIIETKRIEALRKHVERSIGRIQEYKLTSPYAFVDTKVIDILDNVVIISCGLVNLQSKLVY